MVPPISPQLSFSFCLQGIEHLIKSCEFHSRNKDRKNEAAGYTNLGLIYMYKQDFAKALEYYNKALEVLFFSSVFVSFLLLIFSRLKYLVLKNSLVGCVHLSVSISLCCICIHLRVGPGRWKEGGS